MDDDRFKIRARVFDLLDDHFFSDLRVLQLIFNALDQKGLARWPSGEVKDIFYIEDEVLLKALQEYKP